MFRHCNTMHGAHSQRLPVKRLCFYANSLGSTGPSERSGDSNVCSSERGRSDVRRRAFAVCFGLVFYRVFIRILGNRSRLKRLSNSTDCGTMISASVRKCCGTGAVFLHRHKTLPHCQFLNSVTENNQLKNNQLGSSLR